MKNKLEIMRKWFYTRKLKDKIRFLFLILFTTYIITLFFVYYFFIQRNMMKYILESNYNTLISIENNLNVELDAVSTMSQLITSNSNVVEYLKSGGSKVPYNSTICHNSIASMYDISNRFNYISSVYIFRNDKEYINILKQITYVDTDLIQSSYWMKEITEKSGSYVVRINGGGAFQRKTGEPVISVIRLINDLGTQKPIGFIVINLNTDILKNSYKDMTGKDRHFCYYSGNQNALCQNEEIKEFKQLNIQKKTLEQSVKQGFGMTEILSYYHIPNTPLILGEYDKVSFFSYLSIPEIIVIMATIVLSIIYLSIIGIFISVYIEKPIDKLMQFINIGNLKWNKKEMKNKNLENQIENLKKRNSKLIEVNQIIDELLSKEKAMRKAELEVLQEQINPHFLYNTLSTIADLALQISADEIYDAVETLGNFYRRFLSKGSKEITLREEISIVQDYLKLQRLRYQDVFDDEYELQEDVLDFKVPKLILQPLVENSLYHGIKQKGEKGIIKISVYAKDEKLHIVVYDTGVGMSEDQIKSVLNEDNNKSFGLKGTLERIRYYCDAEDIVEIKSEEGIYCEVDINIPLSRGLAGCTK